MIHPMRLLIFFSLILIFGVISQSCSYETKSVDIEEKVVAKVGSRNLYQSDLDKIIHPNATSADSVSLATMYIDSWVRDQLMTREAAKYFSSDFEIEKLVDDYREKLLKFNLEEQVIRMRFDTIVTEGELNELYDEMKDQFILDRTLYRCIFAKFERNTSGLSEFVKDWDNENDLNIITFAAAFGSESFLDTSVWVTQDAIDEWYPSWSERRLAKDQKQRQNTAEYEYFLKVVDVADEGEQSPLGYIRDRLVHMLLHRRKKAILEKYKQDLYEDALNKNIITLPS